MVDGRSEGVVRILLTHILVEMEKWVSMKGDFGRAKVKVLRLDGHVGLLNKYNYRLELDYEYIKATIKTLRMTVQKEDTDHYQSISRSILKRRVVLTNTSEIE